MNYNLIQPPFTLKFREMSTREPEAYFQWFMDIMPERLRELTEAVKQTAGYESWEPDGTPYSLQALGEWFAEHVETRSRTQQEKVEIIGRASFPIEISDMELTNRTFSLAMDIGMYLSHVFLKNHPALQWDQSCQDKKFVDYGQPRLVRFTSGGFNPIRTMVTLAYGISRKSKTGSRLQEIYNIWQAKIA